MYFFAYGTLHEHISHSSVLPFCYLSVQIPKFISVTTTVTTTAAAAAAATFNYYSGG